MHCVQPAPHLEHDGQDGEDDDLDGGPASVPVGSTDTVLRQQFYRNQLNMFSHLAGHSGGLQQGGRPGPLRHDGGSSQSDRHLATCDMSSTFYFVSDIRKLKRV